MGKKSRPRNREELEDLEVQGLWTAIGLANKIGEGNQRITIALIKGIHKTFLNAAHPEAAGRFRKDGEDVKKLRYIEPPPGRLVEERFYSFWREFDIKVSKIPRHPKNQSKHQRESWFKDVIGLAAWTQYSITAIHPFCDGNGRLARLMTNLVLRRFNLPPASVNYEGRKATYLNALGQIDKYQDYSQITKLIAKDVSDAFKREAEIRNRNRAKSKH